jgi:zinc/manganese transport system substrate-binding protein
MHRLLLRCLIPLALLLISRGACAELNVVATTPDLAAIAREVGGARVKVTALALPTQDPHFVDARPHLALEMSRADLLVLVGAELEIGWLPTLLQGSRNGAIQRGARGYLDASTLIRLLEAPRGKVDRSQGDIHPQGNPHYLLDPRRAEKVAVGIGKRLAELDPGGHDVYLANTKTFVARLRVQRRAWEKQLAGLRGKPIIEYHRSLVYLADWVGFDVVADLEPKPGIPPNPRHVAQVVKLGRERRVSTVLQESWYPTTTSKVAATKVGARLVVIPGMTNFPAGQSYAAFLNGIVKRLKAVP